MSEIYLITNNINRKMYVGQTSTNYKKRWLKHINNALNSPQQGCVSLYRAIRKYGKDNFTVSLLEKITAEKANEREFFWIKTLKTQNNKNGYNLTSGGDCFKMSKSCREKLSNKLRGREITWKNKVSVGMKRRWEDKEYRAKQTEQRHHKRGKYKKHSKPLRVKLNIDEISNLYKKGFTIYRIAKKYKVSFGVIKRRICKK
jgi:group I intron endonuclease